MAHKLSKKTITDDIMDLNPTEVAQIVNTYNRTKKAKVKVNPILVNEMHDKLLKELSPITCIHCNGEVVKMESIKNMDYNNSNVRIVVRSSRC